MRQSNHRVVEGIAAPPNLLSASHHRPSCSHPASGEPGLLGSAQDNTGGSAVDHSDGLVPPQITTSQDADLRGAREGEDPLLAVNVLEVANVNRRIVAIDDRRIAT